MAKVLPEILRIAGSDLSNRVSSLLWPNADFAESGAFRSLSSCGCFLYTGLLNYS